MSNATTKVYVGFPGGRKVDAVIGGHVIETDQAREHGGEGAGPEPFDLFLASLATCAGLYVLVFCQKRGIPTDQIKLVQEQIVEEGALKRVVLRVLLPPDFPEKYVDAVRAAASGCRVKKALKDPPEVEVEAVLSSDVAA